ncbi:flavin reductase family protein [Glutamicibacter sp. PS]|uniref:flavin reductase family protein n=1 Tax=Glutamicibacter TaxID=1742989 RepID=UPI00283FF519|nr:flavin reductase family protein [Glutamicibacter sp. PS]MDR4534950.1 flavin reductase family protein [Glutamicibacter sp. PS]
MALNTDFAVPAPLDMRQAMGRFLTGVAVVTTEHEGEGSGMTINSLTSISLEPPILMISLNFDTRTGDAIRAGGRFAVSILGAKQEAVARQFATRGGARFEVGNFDATPGGLPVIGEALSQLECEVVNQYDIGDHQVFFGQVTASRDRDGSGLAFNAGKFGTFEDFHHEKAPWLF